MALSNPFDDDVIPTFTFPPPPPPPRQAGVMPAHERVQSSRLPSIVIIGIVLLIVGGVIALGITAVNQGKPPPPEASTQPQTTGRMAVSHGHILAVCPQNLKTYATCWSLDLPESGLWLRWIKPTDAPLTISGSPGISARGCGGEIYDLGRGGQQFNGACGYLDYRGTDGRPHTVYYAVK